MYSILYESGAGVMKCLTISPRNYGVINCLSVELFNFLSKKVINDVANIRGLPGGRLLATSAVKGLRSWANIVNLSEY